MCKVQCYRGVLVLNNPSKTLLFYKYGGVYLFGIYVSPPTQYYIIVVHHFSRTQIVNTLSARKRNNLTDNKKKISHIAQNYMCKYYLHGNMVYYPVNCAMSFNYH